MCDIAHAVLMERVEAAGLARYQAALIRGIEPPSIDEARAKFDDSLTEEPTAEKPVDAAQMALRRALGVA